MQGWKQDLELQDQDIQSDTQLRRVTLEGLAGLK